MSRFSTTQTQSKDYYIAKKFAWCQPCDASNPDAVPYTYTDKESGKEVTKYELKEMLVSGKAFRADFVEYPDFHKVNLEIHMYDGGGIFKACFTTKKQNGNLNEYFEAFAKKCGNINVECDNLEIFVGKNELKPPRQSKNGSLIYDCYVTPKCDGEKVKPVFTKDSERQLPKWEKKQQEDDYGKMQTVWDLSAYNKAVIAEARAFCDKLNALNIQPPSHLIETGEPPVVPAVAAGDIEEDVPDDLPF